MMLTAVQKTVEIFFIMFFENRIIIIILKYHIKNTDTNLIAIHVKRVVIQIKNMQFVKFFLKKHQMIKFVD